MLFLGKGKARFRKTGETVYVVASNGEGDKRRKTDWVSYIDANHVEHEMVKGLSPAWDFEEIEDYAEREEIRAYETHLCVFSGMAMQGLIQKKSIDELDEGWCIDSLTRLSIEYGKALCAKLDEIDLPELVKNNGKREL
jgi:hypothetical protein